MCGKQKEECDCGCDKKKKILMIVGGVLLYYFFIRKR